MNRQFSLSELPVPLVYATHRIIRDCNGAFAEEFGYSRAELINTSFSKLYPKIADFVRTGKMWQAHMGPDRIYYDERIMARRDGTRFWCKVTGRSRLVEDPFAEAIYCFELLQRPVIEFVQILTDRQRQVVTLVAQGKTSGEIADELGLSVRSVESQRARIMKAVGVANGAELIAWFTSQG